MNIIKEIIETSVVPFEGFTPEQKIEIWAYYETIKLKTIESELLTWIAKFVREHDVFIIMDHCLDMMTKEKFEDDRTMYRDLHRIMYYLHDTDYKKIANIRALTDDGHADTSKAIKEYLR